MIYKIDKNKCNRCGLCAAVCPVSLIGQDNSGEFFFFQDRLHLCSSCGHCMAICPTEAIVAADLSYNKDFEKVSQWSFKAPEFFDFLSMRRSIRVFKDKPVPKSEIIKIIEAVSTAPISFDSHKVKITVVDKKATLEKTIAPVLDLYEMLERGMKNPLIRFFIRRRISREIFNNIKYHLMPVLKFRLSNMRSGGRDEITRGAEAMLIFHVQKGTEDVTADAYIDLTYAFMTAHALGLGAFISNFIAMAINKKKQLKEMLKIPAGDEVIICLLIGYPKYKFLKKIKRKFTKVNWV